MCVIPVMQSMESDSTDDLITRAAFSNLKTRLWDSSQRDFGDSPLQPLAHDEKSRRREGK